VNSARRIGSAEIKTNRKLRNAKASAMFRLTNSKDLSQISAERLHCNKLNTGISGQRLMNCSLNKMSKKLRDIIIIIIINLFINQYK